MTKINENTPGLPGYRFRVSQQKRRDILTAATLEFTANGFEHGAMAEIARVADVSTATLYKHFTSKHQLFEETCDHIDARSGELAANVFTIVAMTSGLSGFRDSASPAVKRGVAVLDDFVKTLRNSLAAAQAAERKERRKAA